jgi:hypothetical protein
MAANLPIKRLVALDLSMDGSAFLITAEMHDGEKAEFRISLKNGDWLAQNMLRLSRAAISRQAAVNNVQAVMNDLDTLVVKDHRISAKPDKLLATFLGHWESSEEAGGRHCPSSR